MMFPILFRVVYLWSDNDFVELSKEILKKPTSLRVKELWSKTFARRREDVMSNPQLVATHCEKYPLLRKSLYISVIIVCVHV